MSTGEIDRGERGGARDDPVVLVVEDEADLAALYARWLAGAYEVRVAHDAERAAAELDDGVDVVLLDRHLPGRSGDELLEEIRASDLPCQVAMVTGVDPAFDIVDMGFDEYLCKPVTRTELTRLVERLLRRSTYRREVRELFALASKKAALETSLRRHELCESDAYASLETRIATARERVDAALDALEATDLEALFRELQGSSKGVR